ncbi:MAG: hypothetical protein AAB320_00350 [Elusimicrobiota bacterium]
MKKSISIRRAGSSVAVILGALGILAATSSAQSPVEWNAGDPVIQLQQRLAEQPAAATPPARPVSIKPEEKEVSGIADPALTGDYRLKEIRAQGFPEKLRSHYCPDRLRVVLDDPSRRVTVFGKMDDEEGPDGEYPGYRLLKTFSPSRLVKEPDEVDRGAVTETAFDGKEVRTTHNGFMLLIFSVVHEYTGLRLTSQDVLVWKHSETVVPAGALLSNDEDYTCHYDRAAR